MPSRASCCVPEGTKLEKLCKWGRFPSEDVQLFKRRLCGDILSSCKSKKSIVPPSNKQVGTSLPLGSFTVAARSKATYAIRVTKAKFYNQKAETLARTQTEPARNKRAIRSVCIILYTAGWRECCQRVDRSAVVSSSWHIAKPTRRNCMRFFFFSVRK